MITVPTQGAALLGCNSAVPKNFASLPPSGPLAKPFTEVPSSRWQRRAINISNCSGLRSSYAYFIFLIPVGLCRVCPAQSLVAQIRRGSTCGGRCFVVKPQGIAVSLHRRWQVSHAL